MTDKKDQLKKLYKDAAYLHLFHNGYKVIRDISRIHWDDEDLQLLLWYNMSELLLSWMKGNKQIYTKNITVAEQAMNEGFFVTISRVKSHIFKKQYT